MAGKPQHSEQEKARAYALLVTNEGNVKRTARELGMPPSTLRRWRDEWEQTSPPDVSEVVAAVGEFLEEAEEVRNLALSSLRKKISRGEGTVAQVATVLGILDDKIARAKGLATHVTEQRVTLPSADEVRQLMTTFVTGAQEAARRREAEIVDAEVVEPKALTPGT